MIQAGNLGCNHSYDIQIHFEKKHFTYLTNVLLVLSNVTVMTLKVSNSKTTSTKLNLKKLKYK